ncbi:hypothetical protein HA402_005918 [Bradysia odoriphaga]|nr:hypothetical protein HA402_005918 [Bradysia odoriphaga]
MNNRTMSTLAAFKKIKLFIQFCGLWPGGISSKYVSMLYNCYGAAMVAFLFLYDLSICAYVFFIETVQEATDNLTTSFTLIALFGKILNLRYFSRKIQKLLRMADEFQLDDDRETEFVDRKMLVFKRLVILFYGSANMAISFNFISTSISDTTRLPYLAWLPFDWKYNSTAYAWLYTYQVIGVIIQANINVSLDLLMAYSMHVASIKFELLGDRLQKLGEMKKDGRGKPGQQTVDLVRCISTYQHIWM